MKALKHGLQHLGRTTGIGISIRAFQRVGAIAGAQPRQLGLSGGPGLQPGHACPCQPAAHHDEDPLLQWHPSQRYLHITCQLAPGCPGGRRAGLNADGCTTGHQAWMYAGSSDSLVKQTQQSTSWPARLSAMSCDDSNRHTDKKRCRFMHVLPATPACQLQLSMARWLYACSGPLQHGITPQWRVGAPAVPSSLAGAHLAGPCLRGQVDRHDGWLPGGSARWLVLVSHTGIAHVLHLQRHPGYLGMHTGPPGWSGILAS